MDTIFVKILGKLPIEKLIKKHSSFEILRNKRVSQTDLHKWNRGESFSFDFQVIFIGKTGYGKSTTINRIIGEIFPTDAVSSCTKELYSMEYILNDIDDRHYFSIGDLPGVGESIEADARYIEMYKVFLRKTDIVVYILRADQRDFEIDEKIFKLLFSSSFEKAKVIIGINFIDKIEPINRLSAFILTVQQEFNLNYKISQVSSIFQIPIDRIVNFSSSENYKLDSLVNCIAKIIKSKIVFDTIM